MLATENFFKLVGKPSGEAPLPIRAAARLPKPAPVGRLRFAQHLRSARRRGRRRGAAPDPEAFSTAKQDFRSFSKVARSRATSRGGFPLRHFGMHASRRFFFDSRSRTVARRRRKKSFYVRTFGSPFRRKRNFVRVAHPCARLARV